MSFTKIAAALVLSAGIATAPAPAFAKPHSSNQDTVLLALVLVGALAVLLTDPSTASSKNERRSKRTKGKLLQKF